MPPTVAPAGPKRGGTLNYAELGDFTSFNPWMMSAVNMAIYDHVFSRLIWKDKDGKEHGGMAAAWEMAPNGLAFKVKLKEGIKWHDGTECTAQDFVTMFEYMRDKDLGAKPAIKKMSNLTENFNAVKALDKYTIEFSFQFPIPYIVDILDYWYAIRIPDKGDPDLIKAPPVGTGPFKMVKWAPKEYSQYTRHPEYFDGGLPYLDQWVFKRLDRAETLVPNLEAGGVDGIFSPPITEVERLLKDNRYVVEINAARGNTHHFRINTTFPPFDKKEVRQAFSYALNRQAVAKVAFSGIGDPVQQVFWSPASLGYVEGLTNRYPFDLDKAAKLMKDAGVKDLEVTTYPTPAFPQMKLYCLIYQADLAKIGVKLNVVEVESARYMEMGEDMVKAKVGLLPRQSGRHLRDCAVFFSANFDYRGDEKNPNQYRNTELTDLVNKAAVETDLEKRRKAYQRANEILTEDAIKIMVCTEPQVWAWKKDVKDVHYTLLGFADLDKAWLDR